MCVCVVHAWVQGMLPPHGALDNGIYHTRHNGDKMRFIWGLTTQWSQYLCGDTHAARDVDTEDDEWLVTPRSATRGCACCRLEHECDNVVLRYFIFHQINTVLMSTKLTHPHLQDRMLDKADVHWYIHAAFTRVVNNKILFNIVRESIIIVHSALQHIYSKLNAYIGVCLIWCTHMHAHWHVPSGYTQTQTLSLKFFGIYCDFGESHSHKSGVVVLCNCTPGWSSLKTLGVTYKIIAINFTNH